MFWFFEFLFCQLGFAPLNIFHSSILSFLVQFAQYLNSFLSLIFSIRIQFDSKLLTMNSLNGLSFARNFYGTKDVCL